MFPLWNEGYYGGGGGSDVGVGSIWDVAIAGRGYMLDLNQRGDFAYQFRSLPLIGQGQVQQPQNVGETALNREDFWRVSAETWHKGAGQRFFDAKDSDRARFRASTGVDVWEPGQLSLLHEVDQWDTTSADDNFVIVAGTNLYWLEDDVLQRATSAGGSFTAVTDAGPDDAISGATSITTNGDLILVSDGTRTHYTTSGDSTYDKFHTVDHAADLIRIVKGRIISAIGAELFTSTATAGSSAATSYYEHPDAGWVWTDIAGGPNAIYFSGFVGDKSVIYRTTILDDGTTLDQPVVAADMPSGEIVRSLASYLSVLLIGTDTGIRIAEMQGDGSLILGALIEIDNPVLAFAPEGRFVYFTWTNYDDARTGLGRLDLSTFNGTTPAYATDLMVPLAQGEVQSVVVYGGTPVFVVKDLGIYLEDDTYVIEGRLSTGWSNFGLPDAKVAVKAIAQWRGGVGSVGLELAVDDDDAESIGNTFITGNTGSSATFPAGLQSGSEFEVTLVLSGNAIPATSGPVMRRVTLQANPAVERRIAITLPLLFHKRLILRNRSYGTMDPSFERAQIAALLRSGVPIAYQEPGASYNVTVDDFVWLPAEEPGIETAFDGSLIVEMKVAT